VIKGALEVAVMASKSYVKLDRKGKSNVINGNELMIEREELHIKGGGKKKFTKSISVTIN